MFWAERIAWLGLALIHFLPAMAGIVPGALTRVYGIAPGSSMLPLMQHRAVMFGAIAAVCVWAAFDPQPRSAAFLVAGLGVLGFLALYALNGLPAGSLRKIAGVDLAAMPLLGFVFWRLVSH